MVGVAIWTAGACANEAPDPEIAKPTTTTQEVALDLHAISREATFRVRNRTCFGAGTGSALLVDSRTLVTNRHVVEGAIELEIETWDGKVEIVGVAEQSARADLAVIRLDQALPYAPLPIGSGTVEQGEELFVAGYPLDGPYDSRTGTALDYIDGDQLGHPFEKVLAMDVWIRPGNSGGPVLDTSGTVVGIVYALDRASGDGLAVPAAVVAALLDGDGIEPVRDCIDRDL